jgi:hypothetical protein
MPGSGQLPARAVPHHGRPGRPGREPLAFHSPRSSGAQPDVPVNGNRSCTGLARDSARLAAAPAPVRAAHAHDRPLPPPSAGRRERAQQPVQAGPDRRVLVLADDEISLPMAGLGAVLRLEGPRCASLCAGRSRSSLPSSALLRAGHQGGNGTAAGMPNFGAAGRSFLFRATSRQGPASWHLVRKPDHTLAVGGRYIEPARRASQRYGPAHFHPGQVRNAYPHLQSGGCARWRRSEG